MRNKGKGEKKCVGSVAVKRDGRLSSPGEGIKITSVKVVAEGPETSLTGREKTRKAAGRQKAPQVGGLVRTLEKAWGARCRT